MGRATETAVRRLGSTLAQGADDFERTAVMRARSDRAHRWPRAYRATATTSTFACYISAFSPRRFSVCRAGRNKAEARPPAQQSLKAARRQSCVGGHTTLSTFESVHYLDRRVFMIDAEN